MGRRFEHPNLIYGDEYKISKRDRAYPYVLGGSIVLAITLIIINEVIKRV